jgi:hypothetical protein
MVPTALIVGAPTRVVSRVTTLFVNRDCSSSTSASKWRTRDARDSVRRALGESSLESVPVGPSTELGKHGHDAEADADNEKELAR